MANAIIIPPLPIADLGVSSAAAGSGMNLLNDYAGVIWQSSAGTTHQIIVDLGRDVPVDCIMLFGLWGDIRAGAYVNIALATSAQGPFSSSFWGGPNIDIFAGDVPTASGNGVMFWDGHGSVGRPALSRYVSLLFQGLHAEGFVRGSRLVIGSAIRLERNFGFGASFGVRDLGALDFSRRGVLQRARGKKLRTVGLTFSNIHKDEVEAQTKPLLERIGNTEMVALVTDPDPHAQRQNRCYYGPLVGDLGQTWRKANLFEAKANMVSVF